MLTGYEMNPSRDSHSFQQGYEVSLDVIATYVCHVSVLPECLIQFYPLAWHGAILLFCQ